MLIGPRQMNDVTDGYWITTGEEYTLADVLSGD